MMMSNEVSKVKMADYSIVKSPGVLATYGLGSCLGIALYDKKSKVGGLIHIMLPESKSSKNHAKYADTGIPLLIEKMIKKGAKKRNIKAKIIGGAQMFNFGSKEISMNIGKRNIKATKKILKEKRIKIVAEDIGKDFGRTMKFYTEDGSIKITSYKRDDLII
jgi:chemotaxis protein CheD